MHIISKVIMILLVNNANYFLKKKECSYKSTKKKEKEKGKKIN